MSRVLPILFNTEMVQAILDGRKTVTRRVVKPQPIQVGFFWKIGWAAWSNNISSLHLMPGHSLYNRMPCHTGDILYVRETWAEWTGGYIYRAWPYPFPQPGCYPTTVWRPSIHMPKEAARIWLKVTDVRVERLQDINEMGGKREGFVNDICLEDGTGKSAVKHFADLWESTIKKEDIDKYGWEVNPWVWVIEFEMCEKPEGSSK
nr:hypothetical protein [uncultured Acetatifactor sp.]